MAVGTAELPPPPIEDNRPIPAEDPLAWEAFRAGPEEYGRYMESVGSFSEVYGLANSTDEADQTEARRRLSEFDDTERLNDYNAYVDARRVLEQRDQNQSHDGVEPTPDNGQHNDGSHTLPKHPGRSNGQDGERPAQESQDTAELPGQPPEEPGTTTSSETQPGVGEQGEPSLDEQASQLIIKMVAIYRNNGEEQKAEWVLKNSGAETDAQLLAELARDQRLQQRHAAEARRGAGAEAAQPPAAHDQSAAESRGQTTTPDNPADLLAGILAGNEGSSEADPAAVANRKHAIMLAVAFFKQGDPEGAARILNTEAQANGVHALNQSQLRILLLGVQAEAGVTGSEQGQPGWRDQAPWWTPGMPVASRNGNGEGSNTPPGGPGHNPNNDAPTSEELLRARREREQIRKLEERLTATRDEYAYRVAGNSRRAVHFKREFRKGGVEEARLAYENARDQLGGIIGHLYGETGMNEGELDAIAWDGAVDEVAALTDRIRREKLLATGNYVVDPTDPNNLTKVEHTGLRGVVQKAADAYYNFHARNSVPATGGSRVWQEFKKFTVDVGAGAVVGGAVGLALLAAAPVGVPAAAIGVAGFGLHKATKAYMGAKISRGTRDSELLVDSRTAQLEGSMARDMLGSGIAGARHRSTSQLTTHSEAQRRGEVKGNRIRAGSRAATLFLGGIAGGLALERALDHGANVASGGNGGGGGAGKVPENQGFKNLEQQAGKDGTRRTPAASELGKYRYPWDWAKAKYGEQDAAPALYKLVDQAQAKGIDIHWQQLSDGELALRLGDSDYKTEDVIRVLNGFAKLDEKLGYKV